MYVIETVKGFIFPELIAHFEALLRYLSTPGAIALYSVDEYGNLTLELSINEESALQ